MIGNSMRCENQRTLSAFQCWAGQSKLHEDCRNSSVLLKDMKTESWEVDRDFCSSLLNQRKTRWGNPEFLCYYLLLL